MQSTSKRVKRELSEESLVKIIPVILVEGQDEECVCIHPNGSFVISDKTLISHLTKIVALLRCYIDSDKFYEILENVLKTAYSKDEKAKLKFVIPVDAIACERFDFFNLLQSGTPEQQEEAAPKFPFEWLQFFHLMLAFMPKEEVVRKVFQYFLTQNKLGKLEELIKEEDAKEICTWNVDSIYFQNSIRFTL